MERTYSKQRKNKDCKFLKNLDRSNKNYNKNDDTYKVQEQKKGKQKTEHMDSLPTWNWIAGWQTIIIEKKNRQMKEAFFFQTRANQVEKK